MERKHWFALLAGLTWLATFILLNWSGSGFYAVYGPAMGKTSAGELNLWLATNLMAMPAAFLVAWAVAPRARSFVGRLDALDEMPRAEERKLLFAATLIIAAFYRLIRAFFILDLPITDDEPSLSFGGEILASGRLSVPLEIPPEYFPPLFLFQSADGVTSFDVIGPQLFWAFSHISGTGPWIFMIFAALTYVGVWASVRVEMSAKWALAACGMLFLSPAMLTLSATTHTHLLSRATFALFLGALLWARKEGSSRRYWAFAGAMWGLGMILRPVETFLTSLPLLIYTLWSVRANFGPKLVAFSLASLPFAAIEIARNLAVGQSVLPLRLLKNTYPMAFQDAGFGAAFRSFPIFLNRLVHNVAQNFELLHAWFLGGIGVALVVFGLFKSPTARALFAGVVALLFFGLLHDNFGVHLAGPIHHSEALIPLTYCAIQGLRRIWDWADEHDVWGRETRVVVVALGLTLSMALQGFFTLLSIRRSQTLHEQVYTFVENADLPEKSVVFTAPIAMFWSKVPRASNSWVFEVRAPRLDLSDDPLLLRYRPGAEGWAREQFPERPLLLLMPGERAGDLILRDLRTLGAAQQPAEKIGPKHFPKPLPRPTDSAPPTEPAEPTQAPNP